MKARKEEPGLERRFFCVGELQSVWEVQGMSWEKAPLAISCPECRQVFPHGSKERLRLTGK